MARSQKRTHAPCVAVYLSHGVDLRLYEGDDFRRTELIKDPALVEAHAEKWKVALLERAWSEDEREGANCD